VNYYSGGGSKLKSVAGEFQKLNSFLEKQKLPFY
ncbi:MAG TPA: restriction endonuclease, partial [Candidatus Pacebacteria bacterium]|nr:restriction endonuclease [Candidatus Paceibacterota bacterium]